MRGSFANYSQKVVTLAVIAGLLGLFVAQAGIQVILAIKPGDLTRLNEVEHRSTSAWLGSCPFASSPEFWLDSHPPSHWRGGT